MQRFSLDVLPISSAQALDCFYLLSNRRVYDETVCRKWPFLSADSGLCLTVPDGKSELIIISSKRFSGIILHSK